MPKIVWNSIECGCATAIILVAQRIYQDAFRTLFCEFSVDMDILVSVATGAAYLFSVIVFALHALGASSNKKEQFFETVCLLITLILAGQWLTARIRSWASDKINTVGSNGPQSTEIRFCNPNTRVKTMIQARELHYEDPIIVSQGERIVTDGPVISGTAQTNESHLTGEPKPQKK
jgi:cation transport ATPase